MSKRFRGIGWLLLCLLFLPVPASAQTAARAALNAPVTQAFPRVDVYLDVRDGQGRFIHSLQAADIQILENNSSLPALEVQEVRPGVQVAMVINPGPSFAIRNNKGVSRYDALLEFLGKWAGSRQGSTLDDLSLLTTNGSEISHTSSIQDWLSTLKQGQVDPRQATPNLDSLFRAADLAADPSPRPGMGRAILFITPPLEDQASLSLENLVTRAQQENLHVFVWMVASAGSYAQQAASRLEDLASQTGGQFFAYTGEGEPPSPESYLQPLRNIYRLAYNSQIRAGGTHQLSANVQTPDGQISTPPLSFTLDVQPPNPAFVSTALEIRRTPPEGEGENAQDDIPPSDYVPTKQELQVIFDFPDGRIRPLVRTALFVDGEKVAENTKAPFDKFTWELKDYTATGQHDLKVEAEDNLGLVGSSIDTIIQVLVEQPRANPLSSVYRNMPLLSLLAVVLAGAVLLLVLVLGGRLRPKALSMHKEVRRRSDPVTQPVSARIEPAAKRIPNWVNRLQWPQRHTAPKAYAFLSQVTELDGSSPSTPIPITAEEVTLGSDPNQATLVLSDPSVEPLHARLIRKEDGSFRLADQGSIAGTWINYTPISQEGTRLEHGDLMHIGRIGFRFLLRQPGAIRKPVVTLTGAHEEKQP